jgi:hypothetical protein
MPAKTPRRNGRRRYTRCRIPPPRSLPIKKDDWQQLIRLDAVSLNVDAASGAYIGSGSVITKDVPDNAMAVERSQQTTREGGAARYPGDPRPGSIPKGRDRSEARAATSRKSSALGGDFGGHAQRGVQAITGHQSESLSYRQVRLAEGFPGRSKTAPRCDRGTNIDLSQSGLSYLAAG